MIMKSVLDIQKVKMGGKKDCYLHQNFNVGNTFALSLKGNTYLTSTTIH